MVVLFPISNALSICMKLMTLCLRLMTTTSKPCSKSFEHDIHLDRIAADIIARSGTQTQPFQAIFLRACPGSLRIGRAALDCRRGF